MKGFIVFAIICVILAQAAETQRILQTVRNVRRSDGERDGRKKPEVKDSSRSRSRSEPIEIHQETESKKNEPRDSERDRN